MNNDILALAVYCVTRLQQSRSLIVFGEDEISRTIFVMREINNVLESVGFSSSPLTILCTPGDPLRGIAEGVYRFILAQRNLPNWDKAILNSNGWKPPVNEALMGCDGEKEFILKAKKSPLFLIRAVQKLNVAIEKTYIPMAILSGELFAVNDKRLENFLLLFLGLVKKGEKIIISMDGDSAAEFFGYLNQVTDIPKNTVISVRFRKTTETEE